MPEKKKQHYVPKFYMQLFTNQQNTFSVLNIATKKVLQSVPYGSHCYKDYYYGKDGVWENRLSDMETTWANTFKLVLSKSPLTEDDILSLKRFALYQRQRTMAEENYSKQVRKESLIEYSKCICANKGWKYEADVIEELCEERANESIAPAEMLQFAEQYLNSINDLSVVIIEYKTQAELFSSDVPVISINPFHQPTIGYGCMGLIMLFPISTHQLVVLYDEKMYPKFKGQRYVELCNEKEVLNLNVLQLISAEKILFGKDVGVFSNLKNSHWDVRERNRNSKVVDALGPSTQKMIGTSLRTTIFDCSFSFGKIDSSFVNIPFPCREAVPRVWEKEWEEKLDIKPNMMSQIAGFQPDILSKLGLTKKEFRQGFEKMAKAAKNYWKEQRK